LQRFFVLLREKNGVLRKKRKRPLKGKGRLEETHLKGKKKKKKTNQTFTIEKNREIRSWGKKRISAQKKKKRRHYLFPARGRKVRLRQGKRKKNNNQKHERTVGQKSQGPSSKKDFLAIIVRKGLDPSICEGRERKGKTTSSWGKD